MNERRKRAIPLVLLVGLLSVGAYFALNRGEEPPASSGAASSPPSTVAAATSSAPPPATSAATDEPAPVASDSASPADDETAPADPVATGEQQAARDTVPAATGAVAAAPPSAAPAATAAPQASATAAPPAPTAETKPADKHDDSALVVGRFSNRVGGQYRLVSVTIMLDGETVYSGPAGPSVEVFRRPPGGRNHTVSVTADYQGNSAGVFSYFNGYKFTVRASRAFEANADGPTQVAIAATERGGVTTAFDKRLGMAINVK